MAEVVPQATLTKALTNNNALDPPPQTTPPTTASSPGSKVDNIDNDGAWLIDLYVFYLNRRHPQFWSFQDASTPAHVNHTQTDTTLYFMLGASPPNSNNGREVRDNSRPITEAHTPSFTAMTSRAYRDEHGDSDAAIDPLSQVRISLAPHR